MRRLLPLLAAAAARRRAPAPATRAKNASWPTPVVVVPAVYREWRGAPPWADKLPRTASVFAYQRLDPAAPRYCPNYGFEAGVHLRFIVDHYDCLPDVALFTQANPTEHARNFFKEVRCLDANVTYRSVNSNFMARGTSYWRRRHLDGVVEQCWRDVLRVFGVAAEPKREPKIAAYAAAQFAASRGAIRRHPRSAWERAYAMLGGARACHPGPLDFGELHAPPSRQRDSGKLNRHTAGAWEHLNHVIVGGQPLLGAKRPRANDPGDCPGGPWPPSDRCR